MDDPFETGPLRERVLQAWAASTARFREDANAEEDYALGGYRDRVVVELAQNAADAATRAGVPGRLRLVLRDGVLTAANTGAPLDAAGVEALSTLRASAKRDDHGAVGRFGVGFAAVVAVSDEPSIASVAGGRIVGVEWSAVRTRGLVAAIPALVPELERREGRVPVLRLPFGLGVPLQQDRDEWGATLRAWDTAVRLPLRDAEAEELVRRRLDQVGPALMLALPALAEIEIELDGAARTLTAVHGDGSVTINGAEWRTIEAHGAIPPELLADRPAEERARPYWQLRWATPVGGSGLPGDVPATIHAPTPSAEPLGLPALLIASFPLAPDRRHVAPGPLTDFLMQQAAESFLTLLRELPVTPRLLDLVPGPIAAGELDAELRRAILARLPDVPLLPTAEELLHDHAGAGAAGRDHAEVLQVPRLRGRDVVAVDGPRALIELLTPVLPGLLPVGWPVRHPALTALGVHRMELADVVDALGGLDREPAWWHGLYDSLAGADTDALGALPVPLLAAPADAPFGGTTGAPPAELEAAPAGYRMVRGPRGLLIAADGVDPAALAALELRFVHPGAAHPLLGRLGAIEAGPRAVLTHPAVRAAVAASYDSDDPEPVARAVLGLVAEVCPAPGTEPWLADLALPGADGDLYVAGDLLLPGGPLQRVVAADAPFGVVDAGLAERYGAEVLEAAGVLRTFGLLREHDIPVTDLDLDLDGVDDWAEDMLAKLPDSDVPPLLPELVAVRDLELVERWDSALRMLAEPPLRAALTEPAQVLLAGGRRVTVPSYTTWWLRRQPVLSGRRPAELVAPGADPLLTGLYDVAPEDLDPELLRALGVRTSLAELLAEPGGADELLTLLADPHRPVSRSQLRSLWMALSYVEPAMVRPPARVRAVSGGVIEVVPAEDALILDSPDLLPLLSDQPLIITGYAGAEALAELLDIPLATEEIPGVVESSGTERPVPDVVGAVLADAPATYVAHDPLIVDGLAVPWRYTGGAVHASGPAGLARGLAWAAGRWPDRLLVEAVLRAPEQLPTLLTEADLELP
ncbi:MAG: sacsin N-terminal ATP-binding-like domain-containing protein [Actinomadura sp.]